MDEMKRKREVEIARLRSYGLDNRPAAMSRVGAAKTRGGVDDGAALRRKIMHAAGMAENTRALLECAIGGKRHPIRIEVDLRACLSRISHNQEGIRSKNGSP